MEKKKKSKKLIITIIVMALIIFGLGSYITYDKVFTNKQKPKMKQSRKIKKINLESIQDNELEVLMKQIDAYNTHLSNSYPITEVTRIDNQAILNFGYKNIEDITNGFTKQQLADVIKKYFGNEFKYTDEDINCHINDGILYKYENDSYTLSGTHGHDGPGYEQGKTFYLTGSHNKETGEYELKTKILYGPRINGIGGPITSFYKNPSNKGLVYEVDVNDLDNWINNFTDEKYDEIYKEVKDKLPITVFTFKKDSEGNYGLIKVEKDNK